MTQEIFYAKRGEPTDPNYVVCVGHCTDVFDNAGPDADGNIIELFNIVVEEVDGKEVKKQVLKPAKERMGVVSRQALGDDFVAATKEDFVAYEAIEAARYDAVAVAEKEPAKQAASKKANPRKKSKS